MLADMSRRTDIRSFFLTCCLLCRVATCECKVPSVLEQLSKPGNVVIVVSFFVTLKRSFGTRRCMNTTDRQGAWVVEKNVAGWRREWVLEEGRRGRHNGSEDRFFAYWCRRMSESDPHFGGIFIDTSPIDVKWDQARRKKREAGGNTDKKSRQGRRTRVSPMWRH